MNEKEGGNMTEARARELLKPYDDPKHRKLTWRELRELRDGGYATEHHDFGTHYVLTDKARAILMEQRLAKMRK